MTELEEQPTTRLHEARDSAMLGQLTALMLTGAPWHLVEREFVAFQTALARNEKLPAVGTLNYGSQAPTWRLRRWWRRQSACGSLRKLIKTQRQGRASLEPPVDPASKGLPRAA